MTRKNKKNAVTEVMKKLSQSLQSPAAVPILLSVRCPAQSINAIRRR